MIDIGNGVKIDPLSVESMVVDIRHYDNGSAHALRITMKSGSVHVVRHGFGVDVLDIERKVSSAVSIARMVKEARSVYDAMTPEQKSDHDHEQRRSFIRGSCPSNRDYEEWCRVVDEFLPPKT